MTEATGQPAALNIGKTAWLRFATEAAWRWFGQKGRRQAEFVRFGEYIRARRHQAGLSIARLASEIDVPYEHLMLLERGLLRPSEIPAPEWARLMRLVEGRESITSGVSAASGDGPSDAVADVPRPAPAAQVQGATASSAGLARIKVIGVGGGGTNAVARMSRSILPGVEYIAVNTDAQHLGQAEVPIRVQIGEKLTRGLGVGGNPEIGREAAEESRSQIEQLADDCDMVFIAAGMGGGTGTGATPVVASLAKERETLTIAVVTTPFGFEGGHRARQAEEGIGRLAGVVDTLIIIPNDRLLLLADREMTADDAFKLADEVLQGGVLSIAELVNTAGEINLDFADVHAVMSGAGPAWIGIGSGRGEGRALNAAREAVASPLLDVPIEGARRVLLNITGGLDLAMREVRQVADYVSGRVDPQANILFGMVTAPQAEDEVRVTVIASDLAPTVEEFPALESLEETLETTVASVEPILALRQPDSPVISWLKRVWTRARGWTSGR